MAMERDRERRRERERRAGKREGDEAKTRAQMWATRKEMKIELKKHHEPNHHPQKAGEMREERERASSCMHFVKRVNSEFRLPAKASETACTATIHRQTGAVTCILKFQ